MKITDMLNAYPEHTVPLPEVSAPSPERTKELTMNKIKSSRAKTRRLPRKALILAAAVAVFTLSAFATGFTLWERARQDLGLTDLDIPEYTEYSIDENAQPTEITFQDEEAENAMGKYVVPDAKIDLVSALCTGNQVTAYVAISPVTQEMADLSWSENQGLYDMASWDIGLTNTVGTENQGRSWSSLATQMEYDPDTETALVRLYMEGPVFEEATELTLSLTWWSQTGETNPVNTVRYYGNVTIPVTHSAALTASTDLSFENTFLPQFSGSITEVEIQAGYIAVTLEQPSFQEACNTLGEDAWFLIGDAYENYYRGQQGLEPETEFTELDAGTYYSGSWDRTLDQVLSDATLTLQDGTTLVISQQESLYSGWCPMENGNGNWDDETTANTFYYQYVLSTPLDLNQIKSITIGGTEYPLG